MDQAEQAYRRDINGLRAIAVAAVLAFHFDAPLPAGFVGVDIFFVVSGYVITRLLLRGATGRDVAQFYWARLLRILPPIGALSAALLAVGDPIRMWAHSGLGCTVRYPGWRSAKSSGLNAGPGCRPSAAPQRMKWSSGSCPAAATSGLVARYQSASNRALVRSRAHSLR